MRRIGLDPGETTGWAKWDDAKPVSQGEIPGGLMGFIEACDEGLLEDAREVVIENFVVEPDFVGTPVASEIIGVTYVYAQGQIVRQQRSDKATLFKQKRTGVQGETERFNWLRDRGFDGSSHELDANTHILVRLKRLQDRAVLRRYWNL